MTELFRNQSGIIDVEDYDYLKLAIIGCGSIGSYLALALNRMGFKNFMLIDDDKVEKHNYTTQYYSIQHVGSSKVNALRTQLTGNISVHETKLTSKKKIDADVIFVCVDSLKERKKIANAILESYEKYGPEKPRLIIDGRMHRLVYQVFTIDMEDEDTLDKYVKGLFNKEFKGKCTEKGIIHNIFAVVSVMVEQFKKCMNGEKFPVAITGDLENYMYSIRWSGKHNG